MSSTKHPAAKCSPTQRAAFERIAIGQDSYIARRTAEALVKRGLVEEYEESRPFSGASVITFRRYRVPIHLHAQWCQWASEQPGMDQ